jgi:hypothetical protein
MSKNKTSRNTPIPFWAKNGSPMTYYTLSENDAQTKVMRTECLARAEESDNPYPQRWFVDEESGLVARLPRTAKGEELARENMRSIWREDKQQERKCSCIAEGSTRCPLTCDKCPARDNCDSEHKETNGVSCHKKCESCTISQSLTVELDMFSDRGDGEESATRFEPADPYDLESVVEDKALLQTLHDALAALTSEDRDLITEIFWNNKTERQLAPELGLKEPKSVNKRKHRILEILRNNETLKVFFE